MKTKDIIPEVKQDATRKEKYISYIPRSDLKQFSPKRVVVYSRVSREGELKHHSIEMQKEHLEQYVTNHPGWIFTGHYVDEGVTGTKLNRPAFTQMMEDARAGKIDIILTKTVSRFGRNIASVLDTIRELRELDVVVIFDNEQLSTANLDSNFQLQYQGIQAEVESRQNSEYQKWAIRNRFKQGIPSYIHVFGYRMENHKLLIVPEEAEVVKTIFNLYLSGMGREAICKKLLHDGVPSPKGFKWCSHTIYRILTNEKYIGDLLLQKYFRRDVITKKSVRNTGELPQYLVEDAHEAIITKDTFDKVQNEIKRRAKVYNTAKKASNLDSSPRLYSSLISCKDCQSKFIYKLKNPGGYKRKIWICHDSFRYGKSICSNKAIPENILTSITTEVLLEHKLIKKDKQGNTPELTNELLKNLITKIIAYPDQTLAYHLINGEVVTKPWQFISRKESWTTEMKKKARGKTLAYNAKNKESEKEAKHKQKQKKTQLDKKQKGGKNE